MDVYEALYTTRAMRRMRPDPIPYEVQARILDAAIRAPNGANFQQWRFLLVDDPALRAQLGTLYRACHDQLEETFLAERIAQAQAAPDEPSNAAYLRTRRSSLHLAHHFAEVPLLLFCFAKGTSGSATFPAAWSAMLAARAEGVGGVITTLLGFRVDETLALLGVPTDEGWTMTCCVAMGYPTGRWGVAPRRPVHEVAARNHWNGDLGFTVPEPLWPRPPDLPLGQGG